MATGCGDVLSLTDLQTAKKHQVFEAEVITGLQGGIAGGDPIDFATNQVTGQVQKTLPAVLRDAGFSPVSWSFTTGGTLAVNDRDKVIYDPASKTWYSWTGALPKIVPAGTNPVGVAGWRPQTDPKIRDDLSAGDGAGYIGSGNYAFVRSYTGNNTAINVYGRQTIFDGANGLFALDKNDTTSPDDDGVVLIDAASRRWKRVNTDNIYAEWWGAVADNGTTDNSAALQAALDYCSGKNRAASKTGRKLSIKGGRYVFTKPLYYTWRSGVVDDGDMRRLSIEGEGTGNTYLIYKGDPSTPAISIQGGSGDGVYLRLVMSNFRLWRSLDLTYYLGVGISITRGAVFELNNVDVGIFNTGVQATDTLYATYTNCDFSGNNQGVDLAIGNFSEPNSIEFNRCFFGGCKFRAAYIKNGANVAFNGCTFEGIGTDGTNEAILYQGGAHEGGSGMSINNCYFENSYTSYDISIENGSIYPVNVWVNSCSFSRPSSNRYPIHGSINIYSASAKTKVSIENCSFKGYNDYAPSASRPAFVIQSAAVEVKESNNYYMYDIERPNYNGFPVVGSGQSVVGCSLTSTSSADIIKSYNVANVVKNSTGNYTVNFKKPLFEAGVGLVSISNGVGFATVIDSRVSSVSISTYNSSGVFADNSFSLIVTGVLA